MIGKIKPIKRIEFKSLGSKPALLFILFIVLFFFGVVILENTFDTAEEMDTTRGLNTSETILADNASAQTLSNTPTSITSTTAWNNSWLSFDGSNDNIELSPTPVGSIFFDNNFSYSVWINTSADVSLSDRIFITSHEILTMRKGVLYMFARNQTSNTYNITYQNINDSSWHHIVGMQFNNGSGINYSLYADGVLVNSSYINGLYHTSSNPTVFFGSTSSSFEGYADELRFYHNCFVLNNSEILEIYNSGRNMNTSLVLRDLTFWLPMNENSGTDIHSFNQSDFT